MTNTNEQESYSENKGPYDATDALKLIHKMMQLGYLSQKTGNRSVGYSVKDKTMDSHPDDNDSVIIITNPNDKSKAFCMTRSYLMKDTEQKLVLAGRLNLKEMAVKRYIHFDDMMSVAKELVSCSNLKYYLIGDMELLTTTYLNDLCTCLIRVDDDDATDQDNPQHQKIIYMSNVGKSWRLPLSFTIEVVSSRMHLMKGWKWVHCKISSGGLGPFIITPSCEEWKLQQIQRILEQAEESIHITNILDQVQYWDMDTAIGFMQKLCADHVLNGTLHYCHSSPSGAFYRPQIHEIQMSSTVLKTFESCGYVSYEYGEKFGCTKKRLGDLLVHVSLFLFF